MNAFTRAPLAPTVTLTLVPRLRDCATCGGAGDVTTGQAADGCLRDELCPNPACTAGLVPNPDFDATEASYYCGCGHQLYAGDDCQQCGAEVVRSAA